MDEELIPEVPVTFHKGRGAGSNARSRFERWTREVDNSHRPEGNDESEDVPLPIRTEVFHSRAKKIISRNNSPDIPFEQSINPFQGCEHGCVYCYARPTHAYVGLSPGIDFETKVFAKMNAAELLEKELDSSTYEPALIALGANTDPYQPIERKLEITRAIVEVLTRRRVPFSVTTKNALVTRDIDFLAPAAERGLCRVNVSLATLQPSLARIMDPRASSPESRLRAIEKMSRAGIPVSVFVSPMIPTINDVELERILKASAEAGATYASMILLRLPREVLDLFVEWLEGHFPLRAKHVMSLISQARGGKDYDSNFFARMKGSGPYAQLLSQRFSRACSKYGLKRSATAPVDTSQFVRPPRLEDSQWSLF
ncbi:PA0069 family radical SAM protein [Pelomonas sp. SE-A7]|uniref:PA0069 family radical SAM protein n=1 Tax=Pelomonas sp. SE-A7 TaxID=3054953 RepID=UPI00259CE88C|nr:PA0069 family radical SAM protein [Pelomonas sp. SE-A7]MDM4765986.1 PA0069 family radical SAM protein [Pelomonas sp. SE-A7]